MNSLHTYGAKIDCKDLKDSLSNEKGWEVCFYVQMEGKPCLLISAVKVSKLLHQKYIGYWCYAISTQEKEEKIEDIPMVCEFRDVFREEFPGLLPWREIDFEFELVLGAQPISKALIVWPQQSSEKYKFG